MFEVAAGSRIPKKREFLVIFLVATTSLPIAGCGPAGDPPDHTREMNVLEIIWSARVERGTYGDLPANYLDLKKKGFSTPLDPVRHTLYDYQVAGDVVTVCTGFDKASKDWDGTTNKAFYGDPVTHSFGTWTHGPGRQCLTNNVAPSPEPDPRLQNGPGHATSAKCPSNNVARPK